MVNAMPPRFYELVNCTTAGELVDAISPTAEYFANGDWIFRGQGRDRALIPSAYRADRMRPMKSRPFKRWSYLSQARAELKLIRRFYKIADRAGLSIPEDSYDVRTLLDTVDHDRDAFVRIRISAPRTARSSRRCIPAGSPAWSSSRPNCRRS